MSDEPITGVGPTPAVQRPGHRPSTTQASGVTVDKAVVRRSTVN